MECVSKVSYSILVNGEPRGLIWPTRPRGLIWPTRGLRQGDPLSPYLFLFCVEGPNAILRSATTHGDIQGFSICRNGPKLTHLFFCR